MKKAAFTLLSLLLLALPFTNVCAEDIPKDAQHLVIHVGEPNNSVQRTMSVSNPEASLSALCSTVNDTGYFQVFGSISNAETKSFWMDTRILKERLEITKLRIYINSPGGSGQDGIGLADLVSSVQAEGFEVEAYATGMVASAAIPVLATCGKRVANPGCMFMVHQAKLFKYLSQESAADLAAQARMMELLTQRYLDILEKHTKRPANEWKEAMEKTTWFSADEALQWGLIDEIR